MTASPRIYPLPLQLANQIAAGEVIERPASVIKELVENSVDAGATEIMVIVEGSGSQLMMVQDNGWGIHPEDLPLALSRHATSKLRSSADLSQITSLGFRGEALPSIGSVSNLILTSRQADSDCGWQLKGEAQQPIPKAHPLGTSIEVRDLFFNLPARRRFLRSARTEQQQILNTLQRLALSRFDIGLTCQMNGQWKMQLKIAPSPEAQLKRIAKICGQSFVNNILDISMENEAIRLDGWIGDRNAHRAQNDIQYFFINGRVIRDRMISHAIRQAFAEHIPDGRHCAYILYLTLPLDRVDVNVHPTKHEVRFREARLIHGLINRAITDTLVLAPAAYQQADKSVHFKVAETQSVYPSADLKPLYQAQLDQQKLPSASQSMIAVLDQRFALVSRASTYWLLDLQQADTELQQQRWNEALEHQQLQHRPILVPLEYPATQPQKMAVAENTALLAVFGLRFNPTQHGLILKQIPALLAQSDLQRLVQQVIDCLCQTQPVKPAIADTLHDLLPKQATFSSQQAVDLVSQLAQRDWQYCKWARQLDKATLTGLFSG